LREGESPVLSGEEEKKGWGLLVGCFYTTLNLEVKREYVITWLLSLVGEGEELLSQEVEQFETIPNLACLTCIPSLSAFAT
jgi:hypothetical protein